MKSTVHCHVPLVAARHTDRRRCCLKVLPLGMLSLLSSSNTLAAAFLDYVQISVIKWVRTYVQHIACVAFVSICGFERVADGPQCSKYAGDGHHLIVPMTERNLQVRNVFSNAHLCEYRSQHNVSWTVSSWRSRALFHELWQS